MTIEDSEIMWAIKARRGEFHLCNMATMDNVDGEIMRRHEMSKSKVVALPRWRRKARLPDKVAATIARLPDRRPASDCGNLFPILP